MKVNKIDSYAPEYPAKKSGMAARIGMLAAAALLAASTASGCTVSASGYLQDPPAITDEPITPEPTDELCVPGEPAVDENGNIIPENTEACTDEPITDEGTEEPALMGDVQFDPAGGVGD